MPIFPPFHKVLILGLLVCLFSDNRCFAQNASIQDCLGAIPVCQKIYQENAAPNGNGNVFDFQDADNCTVGENNSIWYTFTVNQSGQFGFLLTPNSFAQDYDWILFDITNASCADIYYDTSLIVSCNAAGNANCEGPTGATGASPYNNQGPNCGSIPPTLNAGFSPFNDLIDVAAGNTYALCILNFSAFSSNGYTIDFGLSTNIGIFDDIPPVLAETDYPESCNGQKLMVRFSEFIQCATISAANFQLTGTGGPYTLTMSSANCDAGGNYSKEFNFLVSPPVPFGASLNLALVVDGVSEALDLCGNPAVPGNVSLGGPTLTEMLNLGPDTTFCKGQTLVLDSPFSGGYFWSDGSNGATLQVTETGTYWLTINTGCGLTSDTINVVVLETGQSDGILGNDTIICPSGTIELNANAPGSIYLWQDGSTGVTLIVNQPGTYSVTVTNDCGTAQDEIVVSSFAPIAATIADSTICPGESFTYDVTTANATYLWQDGSTQAGFLVTSPGNYAVTVTTPCESVQLSAVVQEKAGEIPQIDLGNDTTLCIGESILLEVPAANVMVVWQDGSSNLSFLVSQSGTYTVTASNECGESQDEIVVDYAAPVTASLQDTAICQGETLLWDVDTPDATYLWQDGSTGPTFMTTNPGTYSVVITTACEMAELSATVQEKAGEIPQIDLGNDTTLCIGESILLEVTAANVTVVWQDGSSNSTFLVSQSGTYSVTVSNECGEAQDEIVVDFAASVTASLQDTTICQGATLLWDVATPGATYLWQDGSTSPTFLVTSPGTYSVVVAAPCEMVELSATAQVAECDKCSVYVPNTFSPNNDGVNDIFQPFCNCTINNYLLQVFSRWGDLVFESQTIENGWDGTFNKRFVGMGVYVYSIQIGVLENGNTKNTTLSGDINIIR